MIYTEVHIEIQRLREELSHLVSLRGSFAGADILALSQRLDVLTMLYYQSSAEGGVRVRTSLATAPGVVM